MSLRLNHIETPVLVRSFLVGRITGFMTNVYLNVVKCQCVLPTSVLIYLNDLRLRILLRTFKDDSTQQKENSSIVYVFQMTNSEQDTKCCMKTEDSNELQLELRQLQIDSQKGLRPYQVEAPVRVRLKTKYETRINTNRFYNNKDIYIYICDVME